MPNFWHFSIILVEQWPLSEATFGHVLAAFAAVNFSLIQPETKRILGMSDDWTIEFILPSYGAFRVMQEFVDNIQTKRLPPIIFWLNYFGSPQDAEIMKRMVQISYRQKRVADCGTLVYLSDHSWTATKAVVGEDGFYHKVQ